ncbi:hypothetical protein SARC_14274 [Sphaeroforma arctica JP610]|uniref:Uncharacterized protein n=1 Tax=Sphaeroforma arctica JP610 TaxID=667725 RepID=A0A0L0F8X8_9EUKA|nr:hypothetical protein SARC_14274 [Sphaeroforma arctica JP610]KNC73167.1 hypothetical protein SARC_14274 [Sphaeroforma arctica JP610]|eukprot:XP_014147069.1 hypothetical protein SARC_14274 [Sphaeroforma arctica JP610]
MLNEKEYVIPGCSDLYCPLEEAKQILGQHLDGCAFENICHNPKADGDGVKIEL